MWETPPGIVFFFLKQQNFCFVCLYISHLLGHLSFFCLFISKYKTKDKRSNCGTIDGNTCSSSTTCYERPNLKVTLKDLELCSSSQPAVCRPLRRCIVWVRYVKSTLGLGAGPVWAEGPCPVGCSVLCQRLAVELTALVSSARSPCDIMTPDSHTFTCVPGLVRPYVCLCACNFYVCEEVGCWRVEDGWWDGFVSRGCLQDWLQAGDWTDPVSPIYSRMGWQPERHPSSSWTVNKEWGWGGENDWHFFSDQQSKCLLVWLLDLLCLSAQVIAYFFCWY